MDNHTELRTQDSRFDSWRVYQFALGPEWCTGWSAKPNIRGFDSLLRLQVCLASKSWYNGGMETKRCTACPEEKPLSDFSWKDKSKGIRQAKCKICYRKLRNEWYQNHKESEVKTIKAYIYSRRKEIKLWFDNLKANKACQHCNDNRPQVLQFHHLDPKKKDIQLSSASRNGWSKNRIEKEIAKCIVLCSNCHIMEHDRLRRECSGS
jgi:hypothetical protein